MSDYMVLGGVTYTRAPLLARLKHDYERDPWPIRSWGTLGIIPQPFRAEPTQLIKAKDYPWLFDVLRVLNPSFNYERAYQLMDPGLCWYNAQWGVMEDSIITGGSVLEVERIENGRVYFKSILISGPVLTAQHILDNHLSSIATSVVKSDRTPRKLTRPNGGPDGERANVRMFYLRSRPDPLWFRSEDVQILPPGVDPRDDPLWRP